MQQVGLLRFQGEKPSQSTTFPPPAYLLPPHTPVVLLKCFRWASFWRTVWMNHLLHSSSQGYGFSNSHVWMWELDGEESWAPNNWCFWTVVLEKTLKSPLDCRRSNQSIVKEISPGCSLEGLMLKLKLQYFDHLMVKSWLVGKDPDAGRDWG